MIRLLDPLGLAAGTWHGVRSHDSDGFVTLCAVELVVLFQLAVVGVLGFSAVRPARAVESVRTYVPAARKWVQDLSRRIRALLIETQ